MNAREFKNIKQLIGLDLLNYILNEEGRIKDNTVFDEFDFSSKQRSVLDNFLTQIQSMRIHHVLQGEIGDGTERYLRSLKEGDQSLYNHYRNICGGTIPDSTNEDKLLEYLHDICIREYPNLLIVLNHNYASHETFMFNLNMRVGEHQTFMSLVKDDDMDSLTNHQDEFEYAFTFTTDNNMIFNTSVASEFRTIIARSFYNACNRMDYSLLNVMHEIETNLTMLRNLAKGEEVEFSTFIGLRGLSFDGFRMIDFDCAKLYAINKSSTPHPYINKSVTRHHGVKENLSGCVLEIKHKAKIVLHEKKVNAYTSSRIYDDEDKVLDNIKFSIIFSLLEDRGISRTFSESGFPLVQPGNASLNDGRFSKHSIITLEQKKNIIWWFKHLSSIDLEYVKIPVKRLNYAIFERRHAEDAIVDAIIAWEGMFSEAFETTFKVTGSIAKYLKKSDDREIFLSRLKKLYGVRSDIVHGKKSKFLESEDIEKLRSEIIKIGVECLMKLLKDDDLLKMSPSERVKKILIME